MKPTPIAVLAVLGLLVVFLTIPSFGKSTHRRKLYGLPGVERTLPIDRPSTLRTLESFAAKSVANHSAFGFQNETWRILVELYNTTGGPNWNFQSGWNTDDHYCTWFGVVCSTNGSVIALYVGVGLFLSFID
jgi:hypothetical protein